MDKKTSISNESVPEIVPLHNNNYCAFRLALRFLPFVFAGLVFFRSSHTNGSGLRTTQKENGKNRSQKQEPEQAQTLNR